MSDDDPLQKPRLFISHSSEDGDYITEALNGTPHRKFRLFYSSKARNSVRAGKSVFTSLDKQLDSCEYFIMVITENYYRSEYCLYEMNLIARRIRAGERVEVLPLVKSPEYWPIAKNIFDSEIQYIDLSKDVDESVSSLSEEDYPAIYVRLLKKFIPQVKKHLEMPRLLSKPYLGMSEKDSSIMRYCGDMGITQLLNGSLPSQTVNKMLKGAKEIRIISTTGSNLIKVTEGMIDTLAHGCSINMIVPDKYSAFIDDVSTLENG